MKKLIIMFSIFVLGGCATTANYEKILNSYMGQSKATLVTNWGVPSGTYQLDEKTELLKYSTEQYVVNNYTPIDNSAFSRGFASGYNSRNGKYWCDTTFTITNGVVSNWQYNGNMCKAK